MKKIIALIVLSLMVFTSSKQVKAQLSYSYTFAATGTSGWSGNGTRTTTSICATTGSIRYNLYSSAPTMSFISPVLNSSEGALVTLSYQTKCINYSGGAGANANSITTKVQYASSTSGPWTDVAGSSFGNTNLSTCSTRVVTFTPSPGTFYVRFYSTWTTGDVYLYLDEISITAPAPLGCSATPVPGNTIASVANTCPNASISLSLQNSISGSGITYQWQSADDAAFTSNVTNLGTASSQTATQTTAKYYRCQVTCAGNGTGTSTPVLVGMSPYTDCYCVPVGNCSYGDLIASVSLNTLVNNSGTTCSGAFVNYTTSTNPSHTTTLLPSSTYNCVIGAGGYAQDYAAWIDYNDDGVFSSTERIGYTTTTLQANQTASFPITLACTPPSGPHRLRVRSAYNTAGSTITPCNSQTYGETEDYIITIAAPPVCPDPGALSVVSTTFNTADLSWVLNCATATAWDVQYGPTGFTLGTGTIVSNISATNSTTISGLNSSTAYQFYIRANCGGNGTSNWSLAALGTTLQAPCAGTPPTASISAPVGICSGASLALAATGTSNDLGITYQWESSTDSLNWSPLAGATTASYTLNTGITVKTWFRLVTTCTNSSAISVSNEVGVNINSFYNCYAASTATNVANEEILGVTLNSVPNLSTCTSVGPGPGSVLNLYSNYRTLGALTTMEQGGGYPITLDLGSCGSNTARAAKVWIDFNQNGVFENPGEMVYSTGNIAAATVNPTTNSGTVLIPITAGVGLTGMRVSYFAGTESAIVPTGSPNANGEVEDYLVEITPLNTVITSVSPTTVCANVGTLVITGSGLFGATAVSVGGTPVLSYVVNSPTQITAVVGSGSNGVVSVTNNGTTVSGLDLITIAPSPQAPAVSPASATVDFGATPSFTASGSETIFNWYTTATGGTSIHTGANFTAPEICSSSTFYVEQSNGTCAGPRTAVSVTMNPLALTISPSNALICSANDSATLSVTAIAGASYVWSNNANSSTITVSPGITTAYSVTVSIANCATTFTQNVGVISGVNLSPSVASSSICYPATTTDSIYSNLSAGNFGVASIPYAASTQPANGVTTLASGGTASTPLSGGTLDDGGWGGIPIGFNYNFFGSNFTTLGVGTNGLVMFGPIPGYTTTTGQLGQFTFASPAFPNAGNPGNVIGLMLSDMNFGTAGSSLRYWTEGIAPTRKFVLSGVYAQWSGGALSTVQLHLYETTGIVEVHIASSAATIARTIGLQDATKTIGAIAPGWNGRTTTLATPQAFRFSPPANYTYSWTSNDANIVPTTSTSSKFEAIVSAPGNYTYTLNVTNPNTGCVLSETVNFNANEAPVASFNINNQVTCFGGANGSVTANVIGGTAPYSYSWAPLGGTNATANELIAGTYTLTVTDANGCSSTATVSITEPNQITPSVVSVTHNSCNGSSNGSAEVSATGGTGIYTYAWAPTGGNAAIANGLTAGTYTVTVTDDAFCVNTITVLINQPLGISPTVSNVTDVSCYAGTNGSAQVDVAGGLLPYTYSWAPAGGTSSNATGLSAGTYTLTITDANNCLANVIITINEPAPLSITMSGTNITCNGSANGTVTAAVNGGTPAYTYSWTGVAGNSATITNLYAGTYAVVVTDSKSCTVSSTIVLTESDPLSLSINNTTNVSCYGGNNGSASIDVSGGTGTISYVWLPYGGTSSTASGLSAGIYTVTATDGNACSNSITVAIFEPALFSASITTNTGIDCYGSSSASATANANGGLSPYTYSWSPSGGNNALASSLSAGVYTVTITDANFCTATSSVEFIEPALLSLDVLSLTHASCNGSSDGSVDMMSIGGTYPYTYTWSPAVGNGSSASGLSAGVYSVTVSDNNNCSATATVTILEPDAIQIASMNVVDALCFASSNGSAEVSVLGGTSPYNYNWMPYGGSSNMATNLSAGIYTVTVSDNSNCSNTITITIAEPTELQLTTSSMNPMCNGGNGELVFSASGGFGTIVYEVNNSSATSPYSVTDGTYTVVAIDANGCSAQNILVVSQPDVVNLSVNASDPLCTLGFGSIDFMASGGTGTFTYQVNGNVAYSPFNALDGTYTIEATDANGCSAQSVVTLFDPQPIIIYATANDALCNGSMGSIDFSASGGSSYLIYEINNNFNVSSPYNALAGTYTLTASDANGCYATYALTINEPSALSLSTSSQDAFCNGGEGQISFSASGGVPFYQYTVNGNPANAPMNAVSATYTIEASDANGCTVQSTIFVGEPTPIVLSVNVVNATCNGANGSLTMNATGGSGNYVYTVNGNVVQSPYSTLAGIYTIVVTDVNGCTAETTATIGEQSAIVLSTTVTDASCYGEQGSMLFSASGGSGLIVYSVNGVSATSPYYALAGTYSVLATDMNGCTSLETLTINEPAAISMSTSSSNALCNGANGSITFSAIGGTGNIALLVNGNSAISPMNVNAGFYTIIAIDANACSAQSTVVVTEPNSLSLTATASDPLCHLGSGSIDFSASGGTGTINYWVNGNVANSPYSAPDGTYTIEAVDANACSAQTVVYITEPSPLYVMATEFNAPCYGTMGSINFTAAGGTGYKVYDINNNVNVSSPFNLVAGVYTLTATDVNGCSATYNFQIYQPDALVLSTSVQDAACNGAQGQLSFYATGGMSSYQYTVNGNSATSPMNLNAGSYTLVATDANACFVSTVITINEPSAVSLSANATNALCNGGNGSINFNATGGTGNFTYLVNGLSAVNNMSANAGTYIVTATDANACSVTTSITVSEPPVLNLSHSATNALCNGGNGQISFNATGGTGAISYAVNGNTSNSPFNAPAGTYTLVATDANACTSQTTVSITAPSAISLSASTTNALCNGANGSINFAATGGTGTITYQVNGVNAVNNMSAPVGNYVVSATDANACSAITSVTISAPNAIVFNTSASNALCNGANGIITFNAVGGTGTKIYTVNGNTQVSPFSTGAGTYTLVATDANACSVQTVLTISQPAALNLTASANHVSCAGGNGSLVFSATGGTGTKVYTINGTVRTSPATVQAGTYTIAVSDANACVATTVITVNTNNALPTVSLGPDVMICQGGSTNLSLSFTGNAPWTYTINNGAPQVTYTNPKLISVSPVLSTQYIITSLSDATCSNSVTDSIWVNTQPCGNLMPLISSSLTYTITYKTTATPYSIVATNTPTSYSATGLPSGLTLASATGVISGTTTALPGLYSVQISAFNQYGSDTKTLMLTVNPRQLSIAGMSALAKVYDGTVNATLSGTPFLVGKASGDDVNVSGIPSAQFNNRNAGNAKPVSVSGYTLVGVHAAYYALTQPTLTASISARPVTITGITAMSKVFDGSTLTGTNGTPVMNNLVIGDTVVLNTGVAVANFTSPTYGYNKPVVFSGYFLSGVHASNYNLSQPANGIANIICAPVPILNIVATGNKATVSWPAGSLQYVIEYRLANSNNAWAVFNTTATSYTLLGLTPATTYEVRMKASCASGIFSDYATGTFSTTSGCSLPVLQSPVVYGNSAKVSWNANADSIYQISYKLSNSANWGSTTNITVTNRTLLPLTTNTSYDYRVRSICKNGDISVWVQGQFTTTSGCGLPSLNTPIAYGNSAKVSWNGTSDSIYQISYKAANAASWIGPVNTSSLSRTLTGLNINTTYNYQVRSICKNKDVSVYVIGQFTTTSGCGLAVISNVSPITGNSARINWTGTSDSIYQISIKQTGVAQWPVAINTSALWYKAVGLQVNTSYDFQIRSVCKNGDASAWVSGQFTTNSGCGLPIINAPLQINGNSAVISWNGSSDSVYQVSFKQASLSNWSAPTLTNTTTTHQLSGLNINTAYDYRIRSICKNGDISNWVNATLTTNNGCPSVTLNTPVVTANSATISWNNVLAIGYLAEFYFTPFQTWVNLGNLPSTSRVISGLSPNTTYQYRVRSSCSNADMSAYTFGTFTTVSAKENNVANATLMNVHAELNKDGDVSLLWNTISERSLKSFEIEHRVGNHPFMPLTSISSKASDGNSDELLEYQTMHTQVPYGLNQYRIWLVGIDGSRTMHNEIISMHKWPFETSVQVYPNPASTDIHVMVKTDQVHALDIKLMDATGRTIKAVSASVQTGANDISVDISQLPMALYTLSVYRDGNLVYTGRFQKSH